MSAEQVRARVMDALRREIASLTTDDAMQMLEGTLAGDPLRGPHSGQVSLGPWCEDRDGAARHALVTFAEGDRALFHVEIDGVSGGEERESVHLILFERDQAEWLREILR